MNDTRIFFLTLLSSLIFFAGLAPAAPPSFGDLSPYRRALFDAVVPEATGIWPSGEAERFVKKYGTRGAMYVSIGFFWRESPGDVENASAVIRTILDCQWKDPEQHDHYGSWPRTPGDSFLDQNWREFIGYGLIVAREYFSRHFDKTLAGDIDAALIRAAEGAAWRSVGPDYTNIAVKSSFLLGYVGEKYKRRDLFVLGQEKSLVVYEMYSRDAMPGEFNSTTYYGCDLMGVAAWSRFIEGGRFAACGKKIEAGLCRELAEYYHADLKTVCGPHFRAYVMSLSESVTPTGLWIAIALDTPAISPLRDVPKGGARGEWVYVPVFLLLQPNIPAETAGSFRVFSGPRTVSKRFTYANGRDQHVRMNIAKNWMMGTATGCTRQWHQHYPGTIHWLVAAAPTSASPADPLLPLNPTIGWLTLHGDNGVNVEQENNKMIVRKLNSRATVFRILISAPGLKEEMFLAPNSEGASESPHSFVWRLPRISFRIRTPLGRPTVKPLSPARRDAAHEIYEVAWETPAPLPKGENALEIDVLDDDSP